MNIYILNLFIVSLIAVISTRYRYNKNNNQLGEYYTSNSGVLFIVILLFLISALRWDVGTDYLTYENVFNRIQYMTFSEVVHRSNEVLFNICVWIIMKITGSPQVVFAFFSFIIVGLFIISIKDYTSFFPLSIFLYITSMDYYSSFNGVRQWIASALLFYSYRYLVTNNKNRYFLMVIIASLFHSSAIVMIPIYFIVRRKAFSKLNTIISLIFIISTIFFNGFINLLISLLKFTSYSHYDSWFGVAGRDAHFLRFIVAIVPVFFSTIYYKSIITKRKDIDFLINFSFLNSMFMLLATRNWIFARFCMYFSTYNVILIPEFLKISDRGFRRILLYLIIVLYFILMILLLPRESHLVPYKSIIRIQ